MARQAGASFTDDSEVEQPGEFGEQLAIQTLGPVPGELFRNVHTDQLAAVVSSATRRKAWVVLRVNGRRTEVPLDWLLPWSNGKTAHWVPCRPDGSPR